MAADSGGGWLTVRSILTYGTIKNKSSGTENGVAGVLTAAAASLTSLSLPDEHVFTAGFKL